MVQSPQTPKLRTLHQIWRQFTQKIGNRRKIWRKVRKHQICVLHTEFDDKLPKIWFFAKSTDLQFFNRQSKAKIEDISEPPTPTVPQDPLNPDWGSTTTVPSTYRTSSSTVTPVVHVERTEWAMPRKDTYGSVNQREPRNVYRFEEEKVEEKIPEKIEEIPPELPSRSTSRHAPEGGKSEKFEKIGNWAFLCILSWISTPTVTYVEMHSFETTVIQDY